jgi:hypothetical protein
LVRAYSGRLRGQYSSISLADFYNARLCSTDLKVMTEALAEHPQNKKLSVAKCKRGDAEEGKLIQQLIHKIGIHGIELRFNQLSQQCVDALVHFLEPKNRSWRLLPMTWGPPAT